MGRYLPSRDTCAGAREILSNLSRRGGDDDSVGGSSAIVTACGVANRHISLPLSRREMICVAIPRDREQPGNCTTTLYTNLNLHPTAH